MALKMQNPLATTTVLRTDNDILFNTGDDDTSYSFEFQPSYAFELPKRTFTFITRALVPLIGAAPEANFPTLGDPRPPGDSTTWGLSDIITQFFVTPKTHASWKGSVGPQFSWKTRTDDDVGGPGWGAGPVAIGAGLLTRQVYFSGTVSHLWEYSGDFNTTLFQPNLYYNFVNLPGAFVAYNAKISADWNEGSSNVWTVPLGGFVGKMFDMSGGFGLELGVGSYWNVVKHGEGANWFLKFQVNLLVSR
jgi:hypothetical protein